jgi:hypothetical protein
VIRIFCDRCDEDITGVVSGAIHGVEDADEKGDGTQTDSHDHVCRDCYASWRAFMEHHAEERDDVVGLLRGMVGLIQLIQDREPELLTNHRYVDALAWLEQREPVEAQP